nr:membrane protein insertion efficiency factor YidD [Parvibium lacunae]
MSNRMVTKVLLALISIYRYAISPWLGPRCRFYPSCSTYAQEALKLHGPWRGSYLSIKRVLRCGPWTSGGVDPVPDSPKCCASTSANAARPHPFKSEK